MTDEEIIKALKCCNDGVCEYCPISGNDCIQKSRDEAIDLINRQKAEIERLQKENEEANKLVLYGKTELEKGLNTLVEAEKLHRLDLERAKIQIRHEYEKEIELLQKRVKYGNDLSDYVIRGAKKEAIKEFAEKLKSKANHETYNDSYDGKSFEYTISTVDFDDIDDVLKEMEGEQS